MKLCFETNYDFTMQYFRGILEATNDYLIIKYFDIDYSKSILDECLEFFRLFDKVESVPFELHQFNSAFSTSKTLLVNDLIENYLKFVDFSKLNNSIDFNKNMKFLKAIFIVNDDGIVKPLPAFKNVDLSDVYSAIEDIEDLHISILKAKGELKKITIPTKTFKKKYPDILVDYSNSRFIDRYIYTIYSPPYLPVNNLHHRSLQCPLVK
jgi:hypothetical protein